MRGGTGNVLVKVKVLLSPLKNQISTVDAARISHRTLRSRICDYGGNGILSGAIRDFQKILDGPEPKTVYN